MWRDLAGHEGYVLLMSLSEVLLLLCCVVLCESECVRVCECHVFASSWCLKVKKRVKVSGLLGPLTDACLVCSPVIFPWKTKSSLFCPRKAPGKRTGKLGLPLGIYLASQAVADGGALSAYQRVYTYKSRYSSRHRKQTRSCFVGFRYKPDGQISWIDK